MRGDSAEPIWRNALLWVAVAVTAFVAVRLLPKTTADPLDGQAIDKAFHVGLAGLPDSWRADWAADSAAARRLRLSAADGRASIDVMAFKGDLDESRLFNVGAFLFGDSSPSPESQTRLKEYGADISRSTFRDTRGKSAVYTTVDVVWHEAVEDYAYLVVARSFRESDPNLDGARSSIKFSPPRLTAVGRAGRSLVNGLDLLETGETWLAILTWILATGWGIQFLGQRLRGPRRFLNYLLCVALIAGAVAARVAFGLPWLQIGFGVTGVVAISGIATAFLSGSWKLDLDD